MAQPSSALAASIRPVRTCQASAAAISVIGYALILRALETSPVSYVVAVRQSSVLFAVALGASVLGEPVGRSRSSGAVLVVAGVALVALG